MKNGIRGWRRRRKEETIGEEQNWRERDKHRSRASWCPNKEGEGETGNTEWCRMRKKEKMKEGKKKEGRVASEWLLNKGLSCSLQRLVKLSYLLHLLFACLICFASSSSRYCPSCLSLSLMSLWTMPSLEGHPSSSISFICSFEVTVASLVDLLLIFSW